MDLPTTPDDPALPNAYGDRLLSWATEIDTKTLDQALATARLPIVHDHVALMPDAHLGFGATVGSVIPTEGAIIPSAVGVDIGCGMIAAQTSLSADDLPDDLGPLLRLIQRAIPSGVGQGHGDDAEPRSDAAKAAHAWVSGTIGGVGGVLDTKLLQRIRATAQTQMGTLGSGNHFVELCLDGTDQVWMVLHSGSRGPGHTLAQAHIAVAKSGIGDWLQGETVGDPDLAWLVQGTAAFDAYVSDMMWAQEWAMHNRRVMMAAALASLAQVVSTEWQVLDTVNCHHNFAAKEAFGDIELWVTRKGAVRADTTDRGVIPGSMGDDTYIVTGKGNPRSWNSCSHGAGRRLSRTAAKRTLDADTLREQMAGRTWLANQADSLIDESPAAYKPIAQVMANQQDLVTIDHQLHQILNYKGL